MGHRWPELPDTDKCTLSAGVSEKMFHRCEIIKDANCYKSSNKHLDC